MTFLSTFRSFCYALFLSLAFSAPAMALEFQFQYDLPSMNDRPTAVKMWETVEVVKGVLEVEVNFERKYLFVTFDDTYTNEEAIKQALTDAGYPVKKMALMLEPREGVMN